MLLSGEPKRIRRSRTPPGYARGNVIVWLEASRYVWRAYWCSSFPFDPPNLNKIGMRLKVGRRTLWILYLLDVAEEKTKDWDRAVTAHATCDGEYFTVMLQENVYIWLTDNYPVLH